MTSNDTTNFIYGLGCLALVGSSLAARRLPLKQSAKMALAWVAIFATAFILFSFRAEFSGLWHQITADLNPASVEVKDGTVRIGIGEDGHYHAKAQLNGHETLFLIDSGATETSLSAEAAKAAGIDVPEDGFGVAVETANGTTVARRARVARLSVGPIARTDMPVLVQPNLGDANLLGMDFLSSLKGWRVEGQTMVLNP
jgi:aspartyl protease family protein